MRSYRLYRTDGLGHIETASILEAESDDDAIEQARKLLGATAGELWLERRRIFRFGQQKQ